MISRSSVYDPLEKIIREKFLEHRVAMKEIDGKYTNLVPGMIRKVKILDPRWIIEAVKDGKLELIDWMKENGVFVCLDMVKQFAKKFNRPEIYAWADSSKPRGCTGWVQPNGVCIPDEKLNKQIRRWCIINDCTHPHHAQHLPEIYFSCDCRPLTLGDDLLINDIGNLWLRDDPTMVENLRNIRGVGKWRDSVCEVAVEKQDFEFLEWCVDRKGYPLNEYTFTACVRTGNLAMLKWLFDKKCPLSSSDHYLRTAAACGHLEVIKWLIENNFKADLQECWQNALHFNHMNVVKWILCEQEFQKVTVDFDKDFSMSIRGDNRQKIRQLKKFCIIKELKNILMESF